MGFLSKITKPFKKVAKSIANIANKIGKATGLTKLMGKLGPVGMLAMYAVMPYAMPYLASAWSGVAGYMSTSTIGTISAMGEAMATMSPFGSALPAGQSITQSMTNTFNQMGTDIVDGANRLFKGAQKFVGVENPSSIKDIGKFVVEEAKKVTTTPATTSTQNLAAEAIGKQATQQAAEQSLTDIAFNIQQPTPGSILTPAAGPTPTFNIPSTPSAPGSIIGEAQVTGGITDVGAQRIGLSQPTAAIPGGPAQFDLPQIRQGGIAQTTIDPATGKITVGARGITPPKPSSVGKNLKKVAKSLLSGLQVGAGIEIPDLPAVSPASNVNTLRSGIGGRASAGGSLIAQVDPALLQLLQQSGRRVEQLG